MPRVTRRRAIRRSRDGREGLWPSDSVRPPPASQSVRSNQPQGRRAVSPSSHAKRGSSGPRCLPRRQGHSDHPLLRKRVLHRLETLQRVRPAGGSPRKHSSEDPLPSSTDGNAPRPVEVDPVISPVPAGLRSEAPDSGGIAEKLQRNLATIWAHSAPKPRNRPPAPQTALPRSRARGRDRRSRARRRSEPLDRSR